MLQIGSDVAAASARSKMSKPKIFCHRQRAKNLPAFRHLGDPVSRDLMRPQLSQIDAVECNSTAIGSQKACDRRV